MRRVWGLFSLKNCLAWAWCNPLYVGIENLSKEVDELKVATFMYQICAAMKYIHSRNVIHLDLKVTKQPQLIKATSILG